MTARHPLAAALRHRHFAAAALLVVAAIAVAIGLAIPHGISLRFVEEGGAVETATLWTYGAAILGIWLLHWPGAPVLNLAAAGVALAAMAAREADLHSALYGISILKSLFYLEASAPQILGALLMLAPVAWATSWLLMRYVRYCLRAPAHWPVAARTLALTVLVMVVAKVLDRVPATVGAWRGPLPDAVLHVMLALEEVLELSLPLFALLAMAQCRIGAGPAAQHQPQAPDIAPPGAW